MLEFAFWIVFNNKEFFYVGRCLTSTLTRIPISNSWTKRNRWIPGDIQNSYQCIVFYQSQLRSIFASIDCLIIKVFRNLKTTNFGSWFTILFSLNHFRVAFQTIAQKATSNRHCKRYKAKLRREEDSRKSIAARNVVLRVWKFEQAIFTRIN